MHALGPLANAHPCFVFWIGGASGEAAAEYCF